MKKAALLTLGAFLLINSSVTAQENEEVRYNQYGVAVDRQELHAEARNNILVLESKDQSYKLWMDNRVEVDGATFWGVDPDYDRVGNGVSIRRARFAVKAQLGKDWYGEVDMDMADGLFELKDAIIEYDGLKNVEIKAGNFKEDFSMERTTTSRYLQLIERPMVTQALAPSRHLGFQVAYLRDHFRASFGTFFQEIAGSEEATNVQDNNKDFGRSQGYSLTSKIGWMPYTSDRLMGFYLGGKASYRTPKTDVSTSDYGGMRFSTRNSTSINRKKYLDTNVIPNVHHNWLYGTEAAAYWKGLKLQSEWIGTHVSVPGEGYNFGGYYVQLGYLLFGGNQRFNVAEGEFTSIAPGKKWGDVELNLRYDYLDLNHRDVYGGSGENYTAGLNFYLGNSIKMAINYMYTSNDRFANGKGKLLTGHDATGKPTADFTKAVDPKGKGGVSYNSIAVRFEVNF